MRPRVSPQPPQHVHASSSNRIKENMVAYRNVHQDIDFSTGGIIWSIGVMVKSPQLGDSSNSSLRLAKAKAVVKENLEVSKPQGSWTTGKKKNQRSQSKHYSSATVDNSFPNHIPFCERYAILYIMF